LIIEYNNNNDIYKLIPSIINKSFINKNINFIYHIYDFDDINNNINDIIKIVNKIISKLIDDINIKNKKNKKNEKFIDIIVDMIYNKILNFLKIFNNIFFYEIINIYINLLNKDNIDNIYLLKDNENNIKKKFDIIINRYVLVILNNNYLNIKYNNIDSDNKNKINEDLKKCFIEPNDKFENTFDLYLSNYLLIFYEILISFIYKYNINIYKLLINILKTINLYNIIKNKFK